MNKLNALKLGFVRDVLGTERTPIMSNLSQLQKYLTSNGVSEKDTLKILKGVFDKNLPPLYNVIIGSNGLCGYWSLVYKRLLDLLGYKCSVCQIDTSSMKYIHTFVRASTSSGSVDLDRVTISDVRSDSKSDLLDYWTGNIKRYFNLEPLIYNNDNILVFKQEFYSESKIRLQSYVLEELFRYVDEVANGDLRGYVYTPLRELCSPTLTKILLGRASALERDTYRLMTESEGGIAK